MSFPCQINTVIVNVHESNPNRLKLILKYKWFAMKIEDFSCAMIPIMAINVINSIVNLANRAM